MSEVKKMSLKTSKHTQLLAKTAMELFQSSGYDKVSVRQICCAAGVPRSTFYTVFSGKADILVYSLQSVKENFQQSMSGFITAANDFERIWFLTNAFLSRAAEVGPELCKAYFILELQHSCELFDILEAFNDWIVQLLANCQSSGIVGIKGNPAELVPIQLNLAKAILFDWVRSDGSFPLRETVRKNIEIFLDVKPQYRAGA